MITLRVKEWKRNLKTQKNHKNKKNSFNVFRILPLLRTRDLEKTSESWKFAYCRITNFLFCWVESSCSRPPRILSFTQKKLYKIL